MDKQVHSLKDYHVGNWCTRAAWAIVTCDLVLLLLQVYQLLTQKSSASSPPLWVSILSYLLSYSVGALFWFFILYAAAVAIEYLIGSADREEGRS